MFKRNTAAAMALSAFALTALCLLSPAVAAQAQTPEPAEGAIDTSRSKLKSAQRTAAPSGSMKVEVWKVSGSPSDAKAAFRTAMTGPKGEFNFGVLPAGRYDLRITLADADADTPRGYENVTVTLEGVVGGRRKTALARPPEENAGAASEGGSSPREQGSSMATGKTDRALGGPGATHWGNVRFDADGRSEVRGTAVTINSSHVEYATP